MSEDSERQAYLVTARDNATTTAFSVRMKELQLPSGDRGPLRAKRMKLLDKAADYQRELIEIEARHQAAGRPTSSDKDRMAELRDRVRASTSANLSVSALFALADEVLAKIDEVRSVA